jgi:carbamoyltransferase
MERIYVGLATSYHDPAMAVVDASGEVLFAEAAERPLRDKRAIGCAADVRDTVKRIVTEVCRPDAEYVIAKSWSGAAHMGLDLLSLAGLANHERLPKRSGAVSRFLLDRHVLLGSVWLQHVSNQLSGGHFADVLALLGNDKVSYVKFPHHLVHAATACFTSPFDHAACMIVDGLGELGSISYFEYRDGRIRLVERHRGPESLGILYSVCTEWCGFSFDMGEEWKVMGLAPYGRLDPDILAALESLVTIDGLTIKYPPARFVRAWVEGMKRWARPKDACPMAAANLAFTMQHFFVEAMTTLLRNFHAMGLSENLVLGGGCALNSSYNGQILDRTGFARLHVPSAPADDGNALGAALLAHQRDHPGRTPRVGVQCPYLGSAMSRKALANLATFGRIPKMRHLPNTVHEEAARLLSEGKLVGWIQGRAEFGPRALGNRSILADPRPADMKDRINSLVKFREEFRPFAPSILDECGDEYFENYQVSRYMERTLTFRECAMVKVPAIVHVNRTGRLQSVRREWNARFYDLIRAFYDRTGVPMVLNTSFNIMGKPMIHSIEDALGLFYTTGLDALAIEDYLIEK